MAEKNNIFTDKNGTPSILLSFFGAHVGGVAIAIFACLGLAGLMGSTGGRIGMQIFLFIAYSFPAYNLMWSLGNRDLNRFHFGHIKRDELRGLKIGALAIIPIFVVSVAFAVTKLIDAPDFTGIYRLINAHVWPTLNMINLDTKGIFEWWQLILFVIIPSIIPVAASTLGYYLGNHDFSPMQKLVYKDQQKKKAKADAKATPSKYPYKR